MYLKKKTLAAEYDISVDMVDDIRSGIIEKRVGTRYPYDSIIYSNRFIRIRDDVFRDAIVNRSRIEAGTAQPFKANEKHFYEVMK